MWQLETGIPFSTSKYECGFVDSVNDVSWNGVYNMNALSGFGQEYPLLVYVHERKKPVNIEETEILKVSPDDNKNIPAYKPMIEDTKALIEEEKEFNNKFNSNNDFNKNSNNFNNMKINNSNDSEGVDEDMHNVLNDEYFLPKSSKQK